MTAFLERWLYRVFRFNWCVATHELRTRMRGARPFLLILGFVLLGLVSVAITFVTMNWRDGKMSGYEGSGHQIADLGRTAFVVLAYAQLALIVFAFPTSSAGAITQEREKRTLEMLRATRLSASDTISGKLIVILAFAGLLLLTTVPIAAWCVLLGGVGLREVFFVYTYLFAVAAVVSAFGLYLSTVFSRSLGAIGAAYISIVFGLGGGTALWALLASELESAFRNGLPACLLIAVWAGLLGLAFYLILMPLTRSISRMPARRARKLLLMGAAFAVFACCVYPVAGLVDLIIASPQAPIVLNPFAGVAAIMYSDVANEMLRNPSGAGATPLAPRDWQPLIWLALTTSALLTAAILWTVAVASYRVRTR